MSIKSASVVAVALVGAAFLFAWVYWMYSSPGPAIEISNERVMDKTGDTATTGSKAVTADSAADDLIDQALADRDDLMAEDTAELNDLEQGTTIVNSLSEVYDDQE